MSSKKIFRTKSTKTTNFYKTSEDFLNTTSIKAKNISQTENINFIPFLQERDGVGNLIRRVNSINKFYT